MAKRKQDVNTLRGKANTIISNNGVKQIWVAENIDLNTTDTNKLLRGKSKLSEDSQALYLKKILKLFKSSYSKN